MISCEGPIFRSAPNPRLTLSGCNGHIPHVRHIASSHQRYSATQTFCDRIEVVGQPAKAIGLRVQCVSPTMPERIRGRRLASLRCKPAPPKTSATYAVAYYTVT